MKSTKVSTIKVGSPSTSTSSSSFPAQQTCQRNNNYLFQNTFAQSLEKSREAYEEKLAASTFGLNEILLENKSSYSRWYLFYAILGPLATFAMDFGAFVLWPMENAFIHPETW